MALGQLAGLSPHLRAAGEPLSMWLVLGPAAVLLGSTALFAVDAVARTWQFSERRRLALALVGGLGVANVAGFWGHPEDCMAVAFVLWAALVMERRGDAAAPGPPSCSASASPSSPWPCSGSRRSWRASPGGRAPRLVGWLVLPSLVVLAAPLVAEPHRTLFVLVRQPFQPADVSFTPLTPLAGHRARARRRGAGTARRLRSAPPSPSRCATGVTTCPRC